MILIVDDKPENIYSLKRFLEAKNFSVDTAMSGEETLKKVLKNNYTLIILDVQMPGMDGFEVAEALSGFNKTKNVPIIFMSAVNTEKRFITKGYASGGIDYVAKPVDPDILLLKVKTFYRLYTQTLILNETQKNLQSEIEVRKDAQEELKKRIEYLHFTLESLPQIAFTASPDGEIDFVNKKWFDYSVTAKSFPSVHPNDKIITQEWSMAMLTNSTLEMEVRMKKVNGDSYRFHLLRIVPIKEEGEVVKWVGTFTDIEDRKQIEKKKDEFLSIASHELKTPLTSIKAYVQLIERNLNDCENPPIKTYITKVQSQLDKLHGLITDLLDISKIENGKLKLNKSYFCLLKMIDNVVNIIHHTYDNLKIKIVQEKEVIDSLILGDENRIEQVLINYLTNAIKYAPDSEQIIISTKKINDSVLVSVTDFGLGITESNQRNLFEKFYRVEETSVKFQGLGIGLYICSEIIKQHGGNVGIRSKFGDGSTFYFTLPLTPAE